MLNRYRLNHELNEEREHGLAVAEIHISYNPTINDIRLVEALDGLSVRALLQYAKTFLQDKKDLRSAMIVLAMVNDPVAYKHAERYFGTNRSYQAWSEIGRVLLRKVRSKIHHKK